jgi:hypothetical protein
VLLRLRRSMEAVVLAIEETSNLLVCNALALSSS